MITAKRIHEIAEELRSTIDKRTGKIAAEFIWKKYKAEFENNFEMFYRTMMIEATFFCSQGDKTEELRKNTQYTYV